MSVFKAEGIEPEVLFWVGCAGSFDDKAQKVTRLFAEILHKANITFGVLGTEESCTGDPAKRAGNEYLFQMQALSNIQTLNSYGIKTIVTTCPHCFNTLKNDYPSLGGNYEVIHHTSYIHQLLQQGKIKVEGGSFKGKRITFHDSCYLGRANNIYEAPRSLIKLLDTEMVEMSSCKSKGLCCGAGGAQIFNDSEKGDEEINERRAEQALQTNADVIAVGCAFCKIMLTDGVRAKNKSADVKVVDVLELLEDVIKPNIC